MTEQTPQTSPPRVQTSTLIAALVLLVCLLAAGTVLKLHGMDTDAVIGYLTAITGVGTTLVALLGKLTSLHQETTRQNAVLAKIDHQTNGVLDARIHTAVHRALNDPIGYRPADGTQ